MQNKAQPKVLVAARTAVRARVVQALDAVGMTVAAECSNAQEAIELAAREHPDVCVLDRDLPGGALAAVAAIASPTRAPKVLLVGGRDSEAERRATQLAGATAYLPGAPDGPRLAAAVISTSRRMT